MRVRESVPKAIVEVKGNGSALIVTDSKATARVSVGVEALLISVGAFGEAAKLETEAPTKTASMHKSWLTPANESHGKRFIIEIDSGHFPNY
jgi:hypothetical protein